MAQLSQRATCERKDVSGNKCEFHDPADNSYCEKHKPPYNNSEGMFSSPLSFKGRIGRLEYGLSFLGYWLFTCVLGLWLLIYFIDSKEIPGEGIGFLLLPWLFLLLPFSLWILLTQGAKRCHDLGHSGLWQFIPFYLFWMILAKGDKGVNQYGSSPQKRYEDQIFPKEDAVSDEGQEKTVPEKKKRQRYRWVKVMLALHVLPFLLFLTYFLILRVYLHRTAETGEEGLPPEPLQSFASEEFEEFRGTRLANANYRVFATYADEVYHFQISAMMTAYIDNENKRLDATTVFVIKHASGKTFRVGTKLHPLMEYEAFRNFVNSHPGQRRDTIVALDYVCDLRDHGPAFNIWELRDKPFVFLDVNFDNHPALLIKQSSESTACQYFNVYGFTKTKIEKVDFAPFNEFKTQINSWTEGYGTNIDYKKKEIIVPSADKDCCACHGTWIFDHYVLDEKTQTFVHHREKRKYGDWDQH